MENKNLVITIARDYGSGGRAVGLKLAEELGIPFYDKNILKIVADNGGLHEDFIAAHEEMAPSVLSPLFGRAMIDTFYQPSLSDSIYIEQTKIIKALAKEGPCVIVGRCADYVLGDDAFKVYITASMEFKIAHKHSVAPEKATFSDESMIKHINEIDKKRDKYYEHYTGYKKGQAENYDLCIKTDRVGGVDNAVKMIMTALGK